MYCVAKGKTAYTYYSDIEDALKCWKQMSEKEDGWYIACNYSVGSNLSTLPHFDIDSYLKGVDIKEQQANFTNTDGKVRLKIKDMTPEQKRAYFSERGLDTKKPKTEKVEKAKREPSEIEKRYMEDGKNMFMFNFSYYTLSSKPTINKVIWNLSVTDKVSYYHDGLDKRFGHSFTCYDVYKANAQKRVEDYIKTHFDSDILYAKSAVESSTKFNRQHYVKRVSTSKNDKNKTVKGE